MCRKACCNLASLAQISKLEFAAQPYEVSSTEVISPQLSPNVLVALYFEVTRYSGKGLERIT